MHSQHAGFRAVRAISDHDLSGAELRARLPTLYWRRAEHAPTHRLIEEAARDSHRTIWRERRNSRPISLRPQTIELGRPATTHQARGNEMT